MPLGFIGGLVSNGMAFLLTVMRARSSAFSASLPRTPLENTSTSIRCVSVPPETTRKPASIRLCGQRARVGHHLLLVLHELRLHGFQEAHRLGGDHVHQRPALHAGEDGLVDGRAVLLLGQDDAGARPAQRLVRGGGDDVGVLARVGMQARGHQPGDVRHVHQEDGAHRVGDLAEAREIE